MSAPEPEPVRSLHARLARTDAGFQPMLLFFLNMHHVNNRQVFCRAQRKGWFFQCYTDSATVLAEFFLPREAFSSYELCAPEAEAETEAAELRFAFLTSDESAAMYRAVLPRESQNELSELGFEVSERDDFLKMCVQYRSSPEPSVFCLAQSADVSAHDFVDIDAQIDLSKFSFSCTAATDALHSTFARLTRCHGRENVQLVFVGAGAAAAAGRASRIYFACESTDSVIRECVLPVSMAHVVSHSLDASADLPEQRFALHYKSCDLVARFSAIAPLLSIYVHTHHEPCFFKYTFPSEGPSPYMYMVVGSAVVPD